MRTETPTFREHDATLGLWLLDPKDPAVKGARDALLRHLRARGFKIGICPRVKKQYRSIAKDYHRGSKGDLRVLVNLGGRHIEVKFFQELVTVNSSGGEYDFDQREKMPYLIGKQYELERDKIAALFAGLGLPKLARPVERTGMAYIQHRRDELEAFQGRGFYDRPIEPYNSRCATGAHLADGMRVAFRGHDGRAWIGTAYANINSMWWVLLPGGVVHNKSASELSPAADVVILPGRSFPRDRVVARMNRLKAAAIKADDFERAAKLRDALKRGGDVT